LFCIECTGDVLVRGGVTHFYPSLDTQGRLLELECTYFETLFVLLEQLTLNLLNIHAAIRHRAKAEPPQQVRRCKSAVLPGHVERRRDEPFLVLALVLVHGTISIYISSFIPVIIYVKLDGQVLP